MALRARLKKWSFRRRIRSDYEIMPECNVGFGGFVELLERRGSDTWGEDDYRYLWDPRPVGRFKQDSSYDHSYTLEQYRDGVMRQLEAVMDDLDGKGRLTFKEARSGLKTFLEGCEKRIIIHRYETSRFLDGGGGKYTTDALRLPYIPGLPPGRS